MTLPLVPSLHIHHCTEMSAVKDSILEKKLEQIDLH
jgi:hypothetical protein